VAPYATLTSPGAVGARLSSLRESRRWSIEDVSTRLKVPPNKLRAIEAGDLSALPDMTFTLGVIRAYAKLLGVDAAPLTGALRQSTGPVEQNLSMPAARGGGLPRTAKMSSVSLSGPPKRRSWLWGIGAIVLAVIVLLLYRSGTEPSAWLAKLKPMTEPAVGASAPAASGASAASGADAPAEASGDAPGAATDTQAPSDTGASAVAVQGASAPAAAAPNAAVATSSPAAQTLAAVAAAGGASAAKPTPASAAAKSAAASASDSTEPVDGQQSIHISVSADSWVSVREAGGKEVISGLLHAGDSKDAVGKPPLQFVIGNNHGVDALEVNGAAVDPSKYANAKGNVAHFTVP
jgi:cytoskeleton protein RodZ